MEVSPISRIPQDRSLKMELKESYWSWRRMIDPLVGKFNAPGFQAFLLKNWMQYVVDGVRPVEDETRSRIDACVAWLVAAQNVTGDEGISYGYFPHMARGGWLPSYPETTGYIITSLIEYGERFKNDDVVKRAIKAAEWEISVQMESGAVQGGIVCARDKQTPAVFNTGMVLDGWCTAYRVTGRKEFLRAAGHAADFLFKDLGKDGYFRTNGEFVACEVIKTYNCLCAWGLHRYAEYSGQEVYREAAIRVIEAALRQQQANGWFANNCLTRHEAPLTHTIGYTLQGVLEVGALAGRQDFLEAVKLSIAPLMQLTSEHGYLPARFTANWQPAARSSCLTGSAQIAIVSYRLYELTQGEEYRRFADRLVNYLKGLQEIHSDNPAINGSIAGSFPVLGDYMRGGYPNWASKYFLDALLLQLRLTQT